MDSCSCISVGVWVWGGVGGGQVVEGDSLIAFLALFLCVCNERCRAMAASIIHARHRHTLLLCVRVCVCVCDARHHHILCFASQPTIFTRRMPNWQGWRPMNASCAPAFFVAPFLVLCEISFVVDGRV